MTAMWTPIDPALQAMRHRYEFAPGAIAFSLALVVDGSVIVVSPPSAPTEASFSELDAHGPVRAIVAPNGYHTLGLAPWAARYPNAVVYAPSSAIGRIEKQSKVKGIRPVAELQATLGDKAEFIEMPGYKVGEVLVRWPVASGWAWFVTDVIFNMNDKVGFPFNIIFKLTRSTPGLRRNGLAKMLMVKDHKALYGWLVEQAGKTPPHLLVPCHGDVARLSDPKSAIEAAVS